MKVLWLLPDDSAHEMEVPCGLSELVYVIRHVGAVSYNGLLYRTAESELTIEEDRMYLTVSLR